MGLTSLGGNEWAREGFNQYVIAEKVDAPNTQIEGRDQVSNALKPVMGIERVSAVSLNLMDKEFGPNGENVYSIDNDDSRIRIVGNGWVANVDHGTHIQGSVINEFAEVTFYGTGLNLLVLLTATSRDIRPTIDGGAEGANIYGSHSSVLASRSYATNQVLSVASGLTLGWHTIKLRIATATGTPIYGFEFLNERADIGIAPGNGFDGHQKQSIASLTTSSYSAGIVGTRGARVLKYIKNGIVSQVVQEVGSQLNLTSADHSNEEIIRRVNFKEFGANRGDDFSTLGGSTSDRVFTLNDGTTTLIGDNVRVGGDFFGPNTNGDSVTVSFVGTGLDVNTNFNTSQIGEVFINGNSVGNIFASNGGVSKVCSGLPYGSHTVKFLANSGSAIHFKDFFIYQPKRPGLPIGALEICDYNVTADFVANTTAGVLNISTGILRKAPAKEFVYVGAWAAGLTATGSPCGFQLNSSTSGDYFEYTFFGTGFDFRFESAGSVPCQVTLDGVTTDFSSYSSGTYGAGSSFVASTGVLTAGGVTSSGLHINGFSLGVHKVRVTLNASSEVQVEALDIITPIHVNDPSFKTGSLSLSDSRKNNPTKVSENGVDWTRAKSCLTFNQLTNELKYSKNISAIIDVSAGRHVAFFKFPFKDDSYNVFFGGKSQHIRIDGNTGVSEKTLAKVGIQVFNDAEGASDTSEATMVCFGELQNEKNLDLNNL